MIIYIGFKDCGRLIYKVFGLSPKSEAIRWGAAPQDQTCPCGPAPAKSIMLARTAAATF